MSIKLGLIGHPVRHSLSPSMHRAAFSFFGIDGSYELLDIDPGELEDGIYRLQQDGFSGFNVTIPHKEAVFRLLKQHSLAASLVGAANTVRIDSAGALIAHNTDLGGFMQALRLALSHPGSELSLTRIEKVLVLGAGGVARACIAGLALSGCRSIVVAARRLPEAEKICKFVRAQVSNYLLTNECKIRLVPFDKVAGFGAFTLVLNCTPVGLAEPEKASWFDSVIASMDRQTLFFDSVYMRDRSPTLLMKMASSAGISSIDGLDMLVEQAVLGFEYWTGRRPPGKIMRDSLL